MRLLCTASGAAQSALLALLPAAAFKASVRCLDVPPTATCTLLRQEQQLGQKQQYVSACIVEARS